MSVMNPRPAVPVGVNNGPILQPPVITQGVTAVAQGIQIPSQSSSQIGTPNATSITGVGGPTGSQTKPNMAGQVTIAPHLSDLVVKATNCLNNCLLV